VTRIPDPFHENGVFSLDLGLDRDARCLPVAHRAELYIGIVPGLPAVPPNFDSGDEEEIRSGMPTWDSPFEALSAAYIGGGDLSPEL
jgi:hypothetical protein